MSETGSSEEKSKRTKRVYNLTDDYNKLMGIEPTDEVIEAIELITLMQNRSPGGGKFPETKEQPVPQIQEKQSDADLPENENQKQVIEQQNSFNLLMIK